MKVRRPGAFCFGLLALGLGAVFYMGWAGTTQIPHRSFDTGAFFLTGLAVIYLSIRPAPAGAAGERREES